MADEARTPDTPFLKRWSQRKLAASREPAEPSRSVPPVSTGSPAVPPPTGASPVEAVDPAGAPPLPPVESLSFDSDYTAFLQPDVDESLKRQALRKLFADPRFNVMDGLDVYIDDYGKFEPIPPELVAGLNQAKFLFDPPKTRVNEHGHVEDVPAETAIQDEAGAAAGPCAIEPAPAPVADNPANLADDPAQASVAPAAAPVPEALG